MIRTGASGRDHYAEVCARARQGDADCARFVAAIESTPDWVDFDRLRAGQHLFLRVAPLATLAFVLGTLPVTYTPAGSARVLRYTGRLDRDVRRRLFETAAMVRDVLQPDAFDANGPGRRAIARVRLLHALVRQRVRMSNRWPEALATPINQLQLGLTALGFGLRVIHGLERCGVAVDAREADGHQHLWRFANTLQGIDPALLPDSLAAEAEWYRLFRERLMCVGEDARNLVDALHGALAGAPPFWLPRPALEALSRRLIDDDDLCDQLGIARRRPWSWLAATAVRTIGPVERLHRQSLLYRGQVRWGRRFFERTVARGLGDRAADFHYRQLG